MMRWLALCLLGCAALSAQEAPIPTVDEIGGQPFAIKNKWRIGGPGNWDYLTVDPAARQLFIAHQSAVQVVDLTTGQLIGEVGGFVEAHAVVLDPDGQTAYASDGRADMVRIFDRRSLQITANISVGSSPRALVQDPQSGLLFAFGSLPAPPPPRAGHSMMRMSPDPNPCNPHPWTVPPPPYRQSVISAIDPQKKARIADIQVCGVPGAAQADGQGHVYFALTDVDRAGRLDATAIRNLHDSANPAELRELRASVSASGTLLLDLREATPANRQDFYRIGNADFLESFGLGSNCHGATSIAVDAAHNRLFAGCANQLFEAINTETGASVVSLTIGPGVDAIAYDAGRGLIFTANGGGYGSLSVIRRDVTDTYSVIQNLPTMERTRTLAVDPSTGQVYMVTDLRGVNLGTPPANGIGTLKLTPVDGSFQVLVIGT